MSNINHKKIIIIIGMVVVFSGMLLMVYALTSIKSQSGIINFDVKKNNKIYELKSDSARSKRVDFELSVKDDQQENGSVIVQIIDNEGSIKFQEEIALGQSMQKRVFFTRGGNERIIITPKEFNGQISYSKKTIYFY